MRRNSISPQSDNKEMISPSRVLKSSDLWLLQNNLIANAKNNIKYCFNKFFYGFKPNIRFKPFTGFNESNLNLIASVANCILL